jgi:23S rRNA (uracil1939-C5)-methyltransferase
MVAAIIIRAFPPSLGIPHMQRAVVESLDHEGRGVTHVDGKAVFIEGGLPGELVEYSVYSNRRKHEQADAQVILRSSSQRVVPRCRHFGVCGGCSMQHLEAAAQSAIKQRVLEDALWHLARLRPESLFAPITGSPWGYRYRARLSVRYVSKHGGAMVGFREKRSTFVADMDSCEVMPAEISRLLQPLRGLINGLSCYDRLPQIEVSIGESRGQVQRALVMRHLVSLTREDQGALRRFADEHGVVIYLQAAGPDSVSLLHPPDAPPLAYELPDFGVRLEFSPTEFTQVNPGVNRMLVRRAMGLLAPRGGERIADLFCGLGNFTLPLARLGAHAVGIEGSRSLIERARSNAAVNDLSERCDFRVANLFETTATTLAAYGRFDKMLIDPPREGAVAVIKALVALGAAGGALPSQIVYISCKPATLARDAAILVHEGGYKLRGAGIANMFPQTSHVESIALFER